MLDRFLRSPRSEALAALRLDQADIVVLRDVGAWLSERSETPGPAKVPLWNYRVEKHGWYGFWAIIM